MNIGKYENGGLDFSKAAILELDKLRGAIAFSFAAAWQVNQLRYPLLMMLVPFIS